MQSSQLPLTGYLHTRRSPYTDIGPDNGPRPIWVANAIKELVNMPAGERPIRMVVGEALTGGIRELNQAQIIAQRQHLKDAGLGSWNKN